MCYPRLCLSDPWVFIGYDSLNHVLALATPWMNHELAMAMPRLNHELVLAMPQRNHGLVLDMPRLNHADSLGYASG